MALLSIFAPSENILPIVQASRARKAAAETRLRFYQDWQTTDLLDQIKRRWATPEDFRLFFINVVKKITDKRAMVYAGTPYRTFDGMDQAKAEALYRAMNANVILKKANRLTKLCKTTALQVGWTGSRPSLAVVTPNILDALHDGFPEEPTRLIVTRPGEREQDVIYTDWTATTYRRFDYRGHRLPTPENDRGVNPYGALPFVPLFDQAPDDQFFLPGGDDLIEAQRAINVGLANLWRAIELQSHGQAWASGLLAGDIVRAGPDRTIALPENGNFGFAAPNTPIEAVLKAIEFLIKQTAVANNLAANDFELEPRAESGSSKAADRRDLIEARADDVELWRTYEARLFEVLKTVVNTHRPGAIPEAATVSIDFGEFDEGADESTRLDIYKKRIELGIWTAVDALMADNPDIRTREEAVEILTSRSLEADTLKPLPDEDEFYDNLIERSHDR